MCSDRDVSKNYGCPEMSLGLPLFNNLTIVEQPVDLDALSDKYIDAAEAFISTSLASGDPFFLYYAAAHMHVPQNHADRWTNASNQTIARGAFGAALLEMDNEVGQFRVHII